MGLSLTGMRIGPLDPTTQKPKVGTKLEVVRPENSANQYKQEILKNRSGFSGGFKILEESRKSKQKKKSLFNDLDSDGEGDHNNSTNQAGGPPLISKDEIFQQLNLGPSDSGMGVGKSGMSKNAISKDLVEGLQKEIDKLKRQQENIQMRKHLAMTGQSYVEKNKEEIDLEERAKLRNELEGAGTFVIAASPQKMQVMRHQASQLASLKNIDIHEIERLRKENEERMKYLETQYFNKREPEKVGNAILKRLEDHFSVNLNPDKKEPYYHEDFERDQEAEEEGSKRRKKRKKSVKIVADEKENNIDIGNDESRQPRHRDTGGVRSSIPKPILSKNRGLSPNSNSRSRGKSQRSNSKLKESPETSPRQSLYEAKFEKYLSNKEQKIKQEKKLAKLKKEDFEIYMRGPDSPSKQNQRFSANKKSASKYETESLLPQGYEEKLILKKEEEERHRGGDFVSNSKDPFKKLGVSNEDKMTFFLLKWIFNAIKRDSAPEDPKLKGKAYVTKVDLVKQLSKNDELMGALGYEGPEVVAKAVKHAPGIKDGSLMWEEFLDFFFLRQADLTGKQSQGEHWWRRYLRLQEEEAKAPEEAAKKDSPQKRQVPRYGAAAQNESSHHGYQYEDPDKKPVKMTESLKILQDTRKGQVEKEVEEEFKALHKEKMAQKSLALQANPSSGIKKKSAQVTWTTGEDDDEDQLGDKFGFKREKSECKLLKSQIAVMQEVFEALDRFQDGILRRSQFIMALRCDERIVEFIDVDAVKVANSKRVLTLDEVFAEVEKDETYEVAGLGKQANQINHKEFITWREFMGYLTDYKEIDERNKRAKEIQKTRDKIQKERKGGKDDGSGAADEEDEEKNFISLMEKEKQRRLLELPKLRPADQIDIKEKELQLLKDLYDGLQKVPGKESVYTIEFFIATRKNPQLRSIATAIARDPEGYSRIPRETFQQVFDRLESDISGKEIDWTTIVEYFTKRGRPLTKEEINKLIEDDRRQREDEEAKKRADEEAERRRIARLMEDLEGEQDFEAYEQEQLKKQKEEKELLEGAAKDHDEEESYGDEEYDSENDQDDEDGDDIERGDAGYTSDPEVGTAKRNYRFGEGEGSHKQRAQSAKGTKNKQFNEGNLKSQKLTTQDYADRQKQKKGKYGVTVPTPFNFDMREKNKKKTIREQKVEEMVAEKRNEEHDAYNFKFRPKPIPPEVLIPRYKTIQEANEMRRLEVKKNSLAITKEREKPFSFYERDLAKKALDQEEYLPWDLKKPSFKANPIPRACSVLIFDQMMKKQEQERQERIRKQAELNFSKAKLPERMQMHSEKLKQLPQTKVSTDQEYTFQPKINELVTKEQFKKQQDKFNAKLNKKKSQQTVTKPCSPKFQKTSSKGLERGYLNEDGGRNTMVDKFKSALMKKVHATAAAMGDDDDKNAKNPSSTKSMTHLMMRRREELEAKRLQNEVKAQEDRERFEKQNRLKDTVQAALRKKISVKKDTKEADLKKKKEDKRLEQAMVKKKIQECVERARQRPLLIESEFKTKNTENLAKIRAAKALIKILEEQGLDPKDHLTDEQKEIVEEDRYIQLQLKQHGKSTKQ